MLHIIYNPIAGHGRAARMRGEVERRLSEAGASCAFHETAASRDARAIARHCAAAGKQEA